MKQVLDPYRVKKLKKKLIIMFLLEPDTPTFLIKVLGRLGIIDEFLQLRRINNH